MAADKRDAAYYVAKANAARSQAKTLEGPEAVRAMLAIAGSYDLLAESMAAQEKRERQPLAQIGGASP